MSYVARSRLVLGKFWRFEWSGILRPPAWSNSGFEVRIFPKLLGPINTISLISSYQKKAGEAPINHADCGFSLFI